MESQPIHRTQELCGRALIGMFPGIGGVSMVWGDITKQKIEVVDGVVPKSAPMPRWLSKIILTLFVFFAVGLFATELVGKVVLIFIVSFLLLRWRFGIIKSFVISVILVLLVYLFLMLGLMDGFKYRSPLVNGRPNQEEFNRRVVVKYPRGTSESKMVKELALAGFYRESSI